MGEEAGGEGNQGVALRRSLEVRRRAQEFVDSLLRGESIEFEGFRIPIPRWIKRIKVVHHSPAEFRVDSVLPSREAAIDAVASSSWARGWATGMLTTFWPEFEALSPEEKEKHIAAWARKLAERVTREYVPLRS